MLVTPVKPKDFVETPKPSPRWLPTVPFSESRFLTPIKNINKDENSLFSPGSPIDWMKSERK